MSNTKSSLLWNPFVRIAGWMSLCIGLMVMVITGIVGAYNGVVFDGALDCHLGQVTPIQGAVFVLSDWFIVLFVMTIGALFIKRGFRFIDLAGTLALARAPFLILAALGFIAQNITIEQMLQEGTEAFTTGTIIFMFITIPIIIWNIVLTYNAIKVSCDIKGKGLTGLVVIGLLVAETLTTALKLSLYKLPF